MVLYSDDVRALSEQWAARTHLSDVYWVVSFMVYGVTMRGLDA